MENGGLRWEGGGGGQCRPLLSLGKEHIVSPRLGLAFWGGNLRGGVPTEERLQRARGSLWSSH